MTQFESEIQDRLAETRASLDEAVAEGDDYLAEVRVGELQSLARLAGANGVDVPEELADDDTLVNLLVPVVVDPA